MARLPAASAEASGHRGVLLRVVIPVALAAVVLAASYSYLRRGPKLAEKDTVVLADFTNSTSDPVFDDTLKTALSVSLNQSPFLNVLAESKVAATLKLMTRPPDTKLTPNLAGELCQRTGSKAYIAGSIASLGSQYVLAVRGRSGSVILQRERDSNLCRQPEDAF